MSIVAFSPFRATGMSIPDTAIDGATIWMPVGGRIFEGYTLAEGYTAAATPTTQMRAPKLAPVLVATSAHR